MEVAGPLGTPLGLAQRKRASPRGEAGTSGFLCVSHSDRRVPAELGQEPVSNNSKIDKINERVFFYIKHLVAKNGFLEGLGSKQVSSTTVSTLETDSNTYMEGVFRQRQQSPQE